MEFRNILIRATNWVGDAVMSIPALEALRTRFPKAHISILARPWVAALYSRESFCDAVIAYQAPKGWTGLAKKLALTSELKQRGFDCAILFQNAFEAAALAWLAAIPVRIGYRRDGRGPLLTHGVDVPRKGEIPLHERFYYLELLKRAGILDSYSAEAPVRMGGAELAAREGRKRLSVAGLKGPVIGVSPGAAYGGAKRWLPERFAESAVRVAVELGAGIAVFGSQEERQTCDQVRAGVEASGISCVNFAGLTSLAEFIGMAAACDAYLSNDSGPMHIASALGVPTVAVFGATNDETTGPAGLNARVVREPVECSPCLLRECPIDHRCMTRVSAERVAEEALQLVRVGRS